MGAFLPYKKLRRKIKSAKRIRLRQFFESQTTDKEKGNVNYERDF